MAVHKRGHVWWYRFTWNGRAIRESTKQTNKRVAEQIEAAHKTSLAKGEAGIRDHRAAPTLEEFAKGDFLPFCRSTFAAKPKTLSYYEKGDRAPAGVRPARECSPRRSYHRKNIRVHPPQAGHRPESIQRQSRTPGASPNVCTRHRMGQGG